MTNNPLANQSRAKKFLDFLRERYDTYGEPDGSYYDTYNGNIKGTLAALERRGLIKTWEDPRNPARTWAAALPETTDA